MTKGYTPKKPTDPRGGFLKLDHDLLGSNAWQVLRPATKLLYIAIGRRLNGGNNGNLEATLASLNRTDGINSSSALAKGLRELEAVGLLARTRNGELSQGKRTCNLFRFTELPVLDQSKVGVKAMPATNEWRRLKTRQDAIDAISAAANVRRMKNASPVLSENDTSSLRELIEPITGSLKEHGGLLPVLSENMVKGVTNRPQTRVDASDGANSADEIESPHHVLSENTSIRSPEGGLCPRGSGLASTRPPSACRPLPAGVAAAAQLQDWVKAGRAELIADGDTTFRAMEESLAKFALDTGRPPLSRQAIGKALAKGALAGVVQYMRTYPTPVTHYRGLRIIDATPEGAQS